jgi:hypothetical protein
MDAVLRYLAENVICKHQLLSYSLVCKYWNFVLKEFSLTECLCDCGMDSMECRVWHGDMKLYDKLNSSIRDQRRCGWDTNINHIKIDGSCIKYNPAVDIKMKNCCEKTRNRGTLLTILAYNVYHHKEFIVPAYQWIEDWLCENTSDFRYSKFVVGSPIYDTFYGWICSISRNIKPSKFATTIITNHYNEIPFFIRPKKESRYVATYRHNSAWDVESCLIYVPYLRITST